MPVRPDPELDRVGIGQQIQARGRHHAAKARAARIQRIVVAEHPASRDRTRAVRTDHEIGVDLRAVVERQRHVIGVLREVDQTMTEMEAAGTDRRRQHGLQIRPMHAPVRATELPAVVGFAAMMADHRAAASVAIDEPRDVRAYRIEGRTQAHAFVEARRIGRQRDGRADFAQFMGLLVELRVDAVLAQCKREGQAADAGADDRDLQVRLHDEGVSDRDRWGIRRTRRSCRRHASYRYFHEWTFIQQ